MPAWTSGATAGPGQTASVFLRGTESNHTLVLVDGVRINPGTIGGAPWHQLDPDLIERIEIVRGPRSTLYGSDAIGGVVQIFTRRAQPGSAATVTAGAGTDETREGAVGLHHRTGDFRTGLDVARYATAGFPARVGGRLDSGHRNTGVSAYGGTLLGRLDAELSHWQAQGNIEYYDFSLTPLDQDFANSATALTLKAPITPGWASTLKLSRVRDAIDQNQSADFAHTRRAVLDWQNDFQLGRHLLTAGVYSAREQTEALVFGSGYDVQATTQALFAQDQWRAGAHRLLVAWRYTEHESFGGHHTGELGYGYELGPAARLYGSLATGFRAPDSTDRFGFGGNPDLMPETSRNREIGARFQLSPAQALHLSLFQNDLDNLINYLDPDGFSGPLPGKNQNVDRARIRGFEAGWRLGAKPWTLSLEGVVQNPENRDTDRLLARRATRSLTLAAGYGSGAHTLGADVLATDSRWDSDFSADRLPGYVVVNLYAQQRLARDWLLRLRLENLFDKDYLLADGYNIQGRAAFVQLQYRLPGGPRP